MGLEDTTSLSGFVVGLGVKLGGNVTRSASNWSSEIESRSGYQLVCAASDQGLLAEGQAPLESHKWTRSGAPKIKRYNIYNI